MYRAALRSSPARVARVGRQAGVTGAGRRMLATAPTSKHGTWKGTALRWAAAIGGLYWYNTSPIFADEIAPPMISEAPEVHEPEFSTVDAVLLEKRKQEAAAAEKKAAEKAAAPSSAAAADGPGESTDSVGALEEEAGQQGAFNPETGEINWDCPCLGGMAHGPCGEEFKTAFSCFVHSEADPKGMDCIDKFQHMQDCFRQYPEIYGAELNDEDEPQDEAAREQPAAVDVTAAAEPSPEGPEAPALLTEPKDEVSALTSSESTPAQASAPAPAAEKVPAPTPMPAAVAVDASAVSKADSKVEDANRLVPKAAFDATSANSK